MKKCITLSILSLLVLSSFTNVNTEKPNNKKGPSIAKRNSPYKLDENQAKTKISYMIRKKFGRIFSFILSLWPFKSQKQKDQENLRKKELQEINSIAQKEIESPENYKRILCQEPFIRYIEKIIKKPVKKIIVEWQECKERIPVTDFKTVRRKRWHEEKLKASIFGKIVTLLSKKSYEYALKKTGNPVIANIVKRTISSELISKIEANKQSLAVYIGKDREIKIENIINQIVDKESYQGRAAKPNQKVSFTTYPSNRCVRCLKSFKQVKRVYLYPCGHNICAQCLKSCNSKCPICRRRIERGVPAAT